MTAIATLPLANSFSTLQLPTPPSTPDNNAGNSTSNALGMVLRSKRIVPDPAAPPTSKKRRSRKKKSANKKPTLITDAKPIIPLVLDHADPLPPITTFDSPLAATLPSHSSNSTLNEPIIRNEDIKSEKEVERLCTILELLEMQSDSFNKDERARKGDKLLINEILTENKFKTQRKPTVTSHSSPSLETETITSSPSTLLVHPPSYGRQNRRLSSIEGRILSRRHGAPNS